MQIPDYCRQIETYLCQKNDGHLIRVVGPSFDLVTRWAAQGIPLKVAFSGVDRCFERHRRKGPRRRPLKIDYCDSDVLEAFDEWRRALGLPASLIATSEYPAESDGRRRRAHSLPAHLERAVMRLTSARSQGSIGEAFDAVIDSVARELEVARKSAHGLRGESRQALMARLFTLEVELLQTARAALDAQARAVLMTEAEGELAGFRDRMKPAVFAHARDAAFDRLVRERFGLPALAFE